MKRDEEIARPDATQQDARRVYERRFAAVDVDRSAMWRVLCESYFQQYVPEDSTVLEIGAGHCEFINSIRAARRIAVDINAATPEKADDGVEVISSSSTQLQAVADDGVDVVFMSNFLEHISRPDITATIAQCRRVLRPGGRIIILQPNIRYIWRDYWMFFDHVTPIDDRALCELLEISGFHIEICLPRFLPYTTQGRLPTASWLIRVYLKLPFLYRLFGGQALVVASK